MKKLSFIMAVIFALQLVTVTGASAEVVADTEREMLFYEDFENFEKKNPFDEIPGTIGAVSDGKWNFDTAADGDNTVLKIEQGGEPSLFFGEMFKSGKLHISFDVKLQNSDNNIYVSFYDGRTDASKGYNNDDPYTAITTSTVVYSNAIILNDDKIDIFYYDGSGGSDMTSWRINVMEPYQKDMSGWSHIDLYFDEMSDTSSRADYYVDGQKINTSGISFSTSAGFKSLFFRNNSGEALIDNLYVHRYYDDEEDLGVVIENDGVVTDDGKLNISFAEPVVGGVSEDNVVIVNEMSQTPVNDFSVISADESGAVIKINEELASGFYNIKIGGISGKYSGNSVHNGVSFRTEYRMSDIVDEKHNENYNAYTAESDAWPSGWITDIDSNTTDSAVRSVAGASGAADDFAFGMEVPASNNGWDFTAMAENAAVSGITLGKTDGKTVTSSMTVSPDGGQNVLKWTNSSFEDSTTNSYLNVDIPDITLGTNKVTIDVTMKSGKRSFAGGFPALVGVNSGSSDKVYTSFGFEKYGQVDNFRLIIGGKNCWFTDMVITNWNNANPGNRKNNYVMNFADAESNYYDYRYVIDPVTDTFRFYYKLSTAASYTEPYAGVTAQYGSGANLVKITDGNIDAGALPDTLTELRFGINDSYKYTKNETAKTVAIDANIQEILNENTGGNYGTTVAYQSESSQILEELERARDEWIATQSTHYFKKIIVKEEVAVTPSTDTKKRPVYELAEKISAGSVIDMSFDVKYDGSAWAIQLLPEDTTAGEANRNYGELVGMAENDFLLRYASAYDTGVNSVVSNDMAPAKDVWHNIRLQIHPESESSAVYRISVDNGEWVSARANRNFFEDDIDKVGLWFKGKSTGGSFAIDNLKVNSLIMVPEVASVEVLDYKNIKRGISREVPLGIKEIEISFNTAVYEENLEEFLVLADKDGNAVDYSYEFNAGGDKVTLSLSAPFESNKTYKLTVNDKLSSTFDNNVKASYVFSRTFTTEHNNAMYEIYNKRFIEDADKISYSIDIAKADPFAYKYIMAVAGYRTVVKDGEEFDELVKISITPVNLTESSDGYFSFGAENKINSKIDAHTRYDAVRGYIFEYPLMKLVSVEEMQ